jgi:hypothetical protein
MVCKGAAVEVVAKQSIVWTFPLLGGNDAS